MPNHLAVLNAFEEYQNICLIHPSSDKSVGITLVLMQYFRITNKMGGWQHEREHSNVWLINDDNRTLLAKVFLPAL